MTGSQSPPEKVERRAWVVRAPLGISSLLCISVRQGVLTGLRVPPGVYVPRFTILSLFSSAYMYQVVPNCFSLPRQAAVVALTFALPRAGNSIAAKIAIIAITTSNSIRVKPQEREEAALVFVFEVSMRLILNWSGSAKELSCSVGNLASARIHQAYAP